MPTQPIVTRIKDGEYSTIVLPNGIVETVFFADDGTSRTVGRTVPESTRRIHERHIAADALSN